MEYEKNNHETQEEKTTQNDDFEGLYFSFPNVLENEHAREFIKIFGLKPMFEYEAYTDGSCNNLSPEGEGGSAYIILKDEAEIKRASKGLMHTTNNRMEMLAIISAVNSIPDGESILVYTDSMYCIETFTKENGSHSKNAKNADLIASYYKYRGNRRVAFKWVKGHNGNHYNEIVDKLASDETEALRLKHNIPIYNKSNSPKVNR